MSTLPKKLQEIKDRCETAIPSMSSHLTKDHLVAAFIVQNCAFKLEILQLVKALEKAIEQRDLYLCTETDVDDGTFDERHDFNKQLEAILEGGE